MWNADKAICRRDCACMSWILTAIRSPRRCARAVHPRVSWRRARPNPLSGRSEALVAAAAPWGTAATNGCWERGGAGSRHGGEGPADLGKEPQNGRALHAAVFLCRAIDRILDDVLNDQSDQAAVAIGLHG